VNRSEAIAALLQAQLDPDDVFALCERALVEDAPQGVDLTTAATVPEGHRSCMDFVARQRGVVAGLPVAALMFIIAADSDDVVIDLPVADGAEVHPGDVVLRAIGPTHVLLRAERPALNVVGHLSGIATLTAAWVAAVRGTGAQIRDTRKTTPGLRSLEKYAVRCGGGLNHRMSLSDAALVKDNHVVAAGSVEAAFRAVREKFPDVPVEVEVDTLEQFDAVVAAGADLILLDNFDLESMRQAVRRRPTGLALEASGGLTLERAHAVAETGVDYLAVGALTHSAPVLDIGADLSEEGSNAARD
jgi:nicotinate-nucleotide pyrophosphorylase (carboxylating)